MADSIADLIAEARKLAASGRFFPNNGLADMVTRLADELARVVALEATNTGDDPIPRYAQLDVWMALGDYSEGYESIRERLGFAETWAQLMAEVRAHRVVPVEEPTETEATHG